MARLASSIRNRMKRLVLIFLVISFLIQISTNKAYCVWTYQYESGWDALPGAAGNIGYGLGVGISRLSHGVKSWNVNRKLRKYIKSCNEPSLELLPPEEAMKIITKRGLVCKAKEELKSSKNKSRVSRKKG